MWMRISAGSASEEDGMLRIGIQTARSAERSVQRFSRPMPTGGLFVRTGLLFRSRKQMLSAVSSSVHALADLFRDVEHQGDVIHSLLLLRPRDRHRGDNALAV